MALHTARAYHIPEPILERAVELGQAFDTVCRGRGPPGAGGVAGEEGEEVEVGGVPGADPAALDVVSLEAARGMMLDVARAYRGEEAAGGKGGRRKGPGAPLATVVVPAGYEPPPAVEGFACVYVLCVPGPGGRMFYVGETESVRRRLGEHRARHGAALEAAVMPVGSKSEGRGVEGALIREMRRAGFPLLSDRDAGRQVAL
jgi:hypothetical protein